jgi:hypothetical protein
MAWAICSFIAGSILFSKTFRLALNPTLLPTEWVLEALSAG